MTRVLVADDHGLIRRGLRQMIERHPGWEVCGEAATGIQVLEQITKLKPDVVTLDVNMPEMDAIELTHQIRDRVPETEVLIFTMHDGEELMCALIAAGARGYILKSDPPCDMVAAIEALSQHLPYFTGKVSVELRESFLKTMREIKATPLGIPHLARTRGHSAARGG